jgi:hypothetical protein
MTDMPFHSFDSGKTRSKIAATFFKIGVTP